jgi:ADP-ribose pyrophosphatase
MRVVSSKTVYKGRIFRLDKDIIEMNGNRITREIIHHPGSSLMIPVLDIKKKLIIMIEQYRYAAGGGIIEFPAGTRDKGESYKTCASRELTEEIGYNAKKIREITRFYLAPGTMTEVMGMFLCTKLEKRTQTLMPDEKIRPYITPLDKAVSMVFSGRIKDAKTIAGVMVLKNIYSEKKLYKKFFL